MRHLDLAKIFRGSGAAPSRRELGSVVLFVFFVTFAVTRISVALDMLNNGPKIYLDVRNTHVHHLAYGICLLSIVGGYLTFGHPNAFKRRIAAVAYGLGLALAFDEFGMWYHLEAHYWERITYDVVSVVTGVLAFITFFPESNPAGQRRAPQIAALSCACILLALTLMYVLNLLQDKYGHELKVAEGIIPRTTQPGEGEHAKPETP